MPLIALITGASSGIGAAVARRLAKLSKDTRLVLAARREERLHALQAELGGPERAHVLTLDVRDREAVVSAIAALPAPFDAIDLLVNNAGMARGLEPSPAAQLDDWDEMVDTNVKGLLYTTRAVVAGMVARKRGHVVNLGSVAGTYPYPGGNVYGATKAFVEQFSLNLRCDLVGTGVRVTCVEPGMVETDFSIVRFKGDATRAANVYRGTQPLTADDVAEAVVWAATLPAHVNINRIEMMPTVQTPAGFHFERG